MNKPDNLLNKSIAIVAHKFLTQPDDELVNYLNDNKCEDVMHILHSFSDASDRRSYFRWYKKGRIHEEFQSKDYSRWPEALIYLKELFFTLKWIFRSDTNWQVFIGMDGLCVFFGNTLRRFRRVDKTVYWAIDFVPERRFKSAIKNHIYHFINVLGYRWSDEMWDLSPRMIEARAQYLGVKNDQYRSHRVVPYGMWSKRIKKYSYDECEKNTVVFIGHLLEKQGVQLVIGAMPEIIEKIPAFNLKIIGDGGYLDHLMALAEDLEVVDRCRFMGKINKIEILEEEVAKSCLGIAPYVKALDTWTYFADPGKVKTYLACGVPLLLTDIPWNAKDIEEAKCGLIITEEQDDIVSKISNLMDARNNQHYRDNAINYSTNFDYENIFRNLNLNEQPV